MEGKQVRLRRLVAPLLALALAAPVVLLAGPASAQVAGCTPPPAAGGGAAPPIGGFNPVTPTRLLDTRPTGRIGAGCVATVDISTVVPAEAAGVALNVTATEAAARGFVTAYPCGTPRPPTSNVNPRVGDPTPNLVIVPTDGSRSICLFTFAATNLIVDVTGWFGFGGGLFHEEPPQRIVDTRTALRPDGGSGKLPAGAVLTIPRPVSVPAGAAGVAVNLTITEPDGPGYATAFPCGTTPPLSSQVNFLPGENRANQTMVGLASDGSLCVFVFAAAHLVVDLGGWFGPGDGGVPLQPITASRLVDSRDGTGGWNGSLAPGETRVLDPAVSGALPSGAHDVLLNVVATQAAAPGYLTVFPCAGAQPPTSSVNYAPGNESTNLVTAPIDSSGKICVFSFERTHVVIDLLGSFGAPGALRSLSLTGLPLDPPFRPDIHDYSLHCTATSNSVGYNAVAMPGVGVSVGASPPAPTASGSVNLAENEALVFTAGTDQYWARCLPRDFPTLTVAQRAPVAPGYYLMEDGVAGGLAPNRYLIILDTNGVPVWYRRVLPGEIDFKLMPDGNVASMPFTRPNFNIDPANKYIERTLDGTVVKTIGAGDGAVTDYHDMIALSQPAGNHLVVSYALRTVTPAETAGFPPCGSGTQVIDGILQEIDPAGNVVWSWNSKDHIDLSESHPVCDVSAISGSTATNAYDLLHINSVDEDPATGDLIVSARYLNAVLRISRAPAGTVLWKIGGYTASNHDGAVHFPVIGDPLGTFVLAHDVRLLANGHLTLFDNRADATTPGGARAAEYTLDATAHTASFVWQRPVPAPCATPTCKSFGLGSVRRQPDGNTVIAWGGEFDPAFSEVDPAGAALLEVSLPPGSLTYRVVKVPASSFDINQLRTASGA